MPEVPWSIQEVVNRLCRQIDMGNLRATVVIAEGAWDSMQPYDWQHYLMECHERVHDDSTISTSYLAKVLKHKCKAEARPTVLGYTQRGRQPSAYDSWFAFEAGNLAVNLLRNGIGNQVIGIKDGRVYYCPSSRRSEEARVQPLAVQLDQFPVTPGNIRSTAVDIPFLCLFPQPSRPRATARLRRTYASQKRHL